MTARQPFPETTLETERLVLRAYEEADVRDVREACGDPLTRAAPDNHASRRVADNCGFVREGVLRSAGTVHEGRTDLVMYGLLPEELA